MNIKRVKWWNNEPGRKVQCIEINATENEYACRKNTLFVLKKGILVRTDKKVEG